MGATPIISNKHRLDIARRRGSIVVMQTRQKVSDEYDGLRRVLVEMSCELCDVEFWVPKCVAKTRRACSLTCSRLLSRKRVELVCSWCGAEFDRPTNKAGSKTGHVFCKRACKDEAQKLGGIAEIKPYPDIKEARASYRMRAIMFYGALCSRCGYNTDKRMLDVHHRDQDRQNNALENLEVMCVWCHALDTRGVKPHLQPGLSRGISSTARAGSLQGSDTGATPVSSIVKGP